MIKKNKIPLKKRVGLSLYKHYRRNEAKLHELTYLFWECTLRCNLNCLHCGSDCTVNNQVKDMPIKDFLKVIAQITPTINPNKTMIVMTGGEPLMRNDIEKCGLELYKRGFPWGIVTNGLFLSQKRLDNLLNSGLRAITISLDGFEEEHNWLRGKTTSFKKARNAIQITSKIKNIEFDVVTCVNKKSFPKLQQLRDELINWGVKKWRLFTIFPIGRAKDNQLLQLTNQQFTELFDFIKETRNDKKIKASYGCEGFLGNYEGEVRDEFFFCRAGISIGSVLADGSISACPSLRNNFVQGNIYKDNFVEIWENKFQKMRERSWTKTGLCKTCKYFDFCEGNGLHLRDEKTGELLFCHYNKIINNEQ